MNNSGKSSYSLGRQAEAAAAQYLKDLGYTILEQNWRTAWCEIDIVAIKEQVVYFVEVKFRSTNTNGSGLDYISEAKLKQMARSAESWVLAKGWEDDYQLSAIELEGPDFSVKTFTKDV